MITLWELEGKGGRRYSLFSWRARMALRHKGLEFATRPVLLSDKKAIEFDADGEEIGRRPKYTHVKFKAHYEDRCSTENHKVTAPPYPELDQDRGLRWPRLDRACGSDGERGLVLHDAAEDPVDEAGRLVGGELPDEVQRLADRDRVRGVLDPEDLVDADP